MANNRHGTFSSVMGLTTTSDELPRAKLGPVLTVGDAIRSYGGLLTAAWHHTQCFVTTECGCKAATKNRGCHLSCSGSRTATGFILADTSDRFRSISCVLLSFLVSRRSRPCPRRCPISNGQTLKPRTMPVGVGMPVESTKRTGSASIGIFALGPLPNRIAIPKY